MMTIQRGSGQRLPFVDVRDFGAIGDGTNDDTSAINSAINSATPGVTIFFPAGTYKITTSLTISKLGVILRGVGRGSSIISNSSSSHAIILANGLNNAEIRDMSIIGQTGSADCVHANDGSIGHVRLINLWLEAKNDGVNCNAGDGVHLYLDSVRAYGGNIPFNLQPSPVAVNTITAINCYAQNASGNAGWKVDNVPAFTAIGCSSDNNFYGFELLDTKANLISCTAENNSSKGFYGHGNGQYIFQNCSTYSQLMPFEINHSNASATWINPVTGATPSGASINVAASNGDCIMLGRGVLDGGLQGSSIAHFAGYTSSSGLQTNAFNINTSYTPSSASASGVAGKISWDTSYIYVCTATNTWKRAALSTW